jgi:sugar phosphate isomerase/epimerase
VIPNTNDQSARDPRLCCFMNELALNDMKVPGLARGRSLMESIREAGYDGLQAGDQISRESMHACERLGLKVAGSGRVNVAQEADPVAAKLADCGFTCGTLHLGWGMEDDAAACGLIEAVLKAAERRKLPLYIETHRATIFQDMWRTVQFVRRYPEIRINGDFSHWYTGQEMVYGGFDNKFHFIEPILERVRFLHGRIGNPGCMQVDIGYGKVDGQPFVGHFRKMWIAAMGAFLQSAAPGDYLTFVPELLAPGIFYARLVRDAEGKMHEEGDRWEQSLVLCRIARECFEKASRPRT